MEEESIEDIAGRLRRNETGYSCLDLMMNPGFEAVDINLLTEAVLANQTLKEVKFFGILGDDDVNEATGRLVESFARLPKLNTLSIFGYCQDIVARLNNILYHRAQTLEHLRLTYVHFNGPDLWMTTFQQCLQNMKRLESFFLLDCQFSERLRDSNAIDKIIMSLSKLPNLEKVGIQPLETDAIGTLSTDSLVALCRLRELSYLSIRGLSFPESFPHLEQMMAALRNSCTIRDLIFQSSTSEDNCTSIESLIRGSKSLECVHVRIGAEGKQDDKHIVKIAEALQENASIKRLTIEYRHLSNINFNPSTLAKFGKLLEGNYSIEDIIFISNATPGIGHDPLVSMYLKLNLLGRGALIQGEQTSRQQWVEKLLEVNDYLDGIYYFLSMNPLLCEVPNQLEGCHRLRSGQGDNTCINGTRSIPKTIFAPCSIKTERCRDRKS